jgi:hypothetical protein
MESDLSLKMGVVALFVVMALGVSGPTAVTLLSFPSVLAQNVTGANVTGANVTGANVTGANISVEQLNQKIRAWEDTVVGLGKVSSNLTDDEVSQLHKDPMTYMKQHDIPIPAGVKLLSVDFYKPVIEPITDKSPDTIYSYRLLGTGCNNSEHYCCDVYINDENGHWYTACYSI